MEKLAPTRTGEAIIRVNHARISASWAFKSRPGHAGLAQSILGFRSREETELPTGGLGIQSPDPLILLLLTPKAPLAPSHPSYGNSSGVFREETEIKTFGRQRGGGPSDSLSHAQAQAGVQ